MKLNKLILLCAAVLALSACQTQSAPNSSSPSTSTPKPGSSQAAKYQYIFKTPTHPLQLNLTLDKAHSGQATIGRSGGQVKATGADGTIYTLDIPKEALAAATHITMTPLAKITGMPFDGKTSYAVQLQPEGLYLYYDAILTITPGKTGGAPVKPIPTPQQLFFSYQAAGKMVGLAIPVLKTKDLQVRLMHFSGYGVADGSAADIAAIEGQLGGDVRSAIESLTAEVIAQMRQDQENGTTSADPQLGQTVVDLIDQWDRDVVQPSLESAGTSCLAGKQAMRDLLDMERTRQLLGLPSSSANMAKAVALAKSGAIVCIKEEYQRCLEDHVINGMIPLYIDQLRQVQIEKDNGGAVPAEPEGLALARDLTAKCLTFELQFHSQGKFDTGDGGYNSTVDGKIKLHFDPATFTIQGRGPLDNLAFAFKPPKGGKGMTCTAASKTGGGTAEVKALEYVEDTRSETDPELYVRDFKLLYFPGITSESYQINCILTDSQGKKTKQDYTAAPSGYWSGIFFILHQEELNAGSAGPQAGGPPPMPDIAAMMVGALPPMPAPTMPADGGFFADAWDITSGDVQLASKEWIKDNPGINLNETGTLKLLHRPGQ